MSSIWKERKKANRTHTVACNASTSIHSHSCAHTRREVFSDFSKILFSAKKTSKRLRATHTAAYAHMQGHSYADPHGRTSEHIHTRICFNQRIVPLACVSNTEVRVCISPVTPWSVWIIIIAHVSGDKKTLLAFGLQFWRKHSTIYNYKCVSTLTLTLTNIQMYICLRVANANTCTRT